MRLFVLCCVALVGCDVEPSAGAPVASEAAQDRAALPSPALTDLTKRVAALEADQKALRVEYQKALATVQAQQSSVEQRVAKLEGQATDLDLRTASLEASFRTLQADSKSLSTLVEGLGQRTTKLESQLQVVLDDIDIFSAKLDSVTAGAGAQGLAIAKLNEQVGLIFDDIDVMMLTDQKLQAAIGAPWFYDDIDSVSVGDELTSLRKFTGSGIVLDDADYPSSLAGRVDQVGADVKSVAAADVTQDERLTKVEDQTTWLEDRVLQLWTAVFGP